MAIANYVFDSIPQELLYFNQGHCHPCLVTVAADGDVDQSDTAATLAQLHLTYSYQENADALYPQPWLQGLVYSYQQQCEDSHILFPFAALECLQRLRALSRHGLLLLSADKGEHRLEAWQGARPPRLVQHGSFSLNVNYHAIRAYCEQEGGLALFPDHPHDSLNVNCCMLIEQAQRHTGTRMAYQRRVNQGGPDAFYTMSKHALEHVDTMSAWDMLAYLRLSHYDGLFLFTFLPRLHKLGPALDGLMLVAFREAIELVWAGHFPLGHDDDLASAIARLFYALGDYRTALIYFARAGEMYGEDTGTLFNMAACHHMLDEAAEAIGLLLEVINSDPHNQAAGQLLADIATP